VGVLNRSDAQLLWETWRIVHERRSDARLILIGNPRCQVPRDESIVRSGFVSRDMLQTLMAACDLMILPLKDNIASRGRWPSKLNDYLAAGRPTVATAVGDCRELFANHRIGQTAADDPSALAAAVLALLDQPAECRSMGKAARRLAEEQFAWPILTARLDAHYQFAQRASSAASE
jgi:glycosyltransferase involved in cell wall biosynthesis